MIDGQALGDGQDALYAAQRLAAFLPKLPGTKMIVRLEIDVRLFGIENLLQRELHFLPSFVRGSNELSAVHGRHRGGTACPGNSLHDRHLLVVVHEQPAGPSDFANHVHHPGPVDDQSVARENLDIVFGGFSQIGWEGNLQRLLGMITVSQVSVTAAIDADILAEVWQAVNADAQQVAAANPQLTRRVKQRNLPNTIRQSSTSRLKAA